MEHPWLFKKKIDNDNNNDNDNDNENKFIAKIVQRKALQNAVHGIHIKTDKQEKTYWRINFDNGGRSRTYVPQVNLNNIFIIVRWAGTGCYVQGA